MAELTEEEIQRGIDRAESVRKKLNQEFPELLIVRSIYDYLIAIVSRSSLPADYDDYDDSEESEAVDAAICQEDGDEFLTLDLSLSEIEMEVLLREYVAKYLRANR